MKDFIKSFNEIGIADIAAVGGKNASLGEMLSELAPKGIRIPEGFATTAFAYWTFLDFNGLWEHLYGIMQHLDRKNFSNLRETGKQARELILQGKIPEMIAEQITQSYRQLSVHKHIAVAVRSSATAEDLPQASFAGQHESYLNITGEEALLQAVQRCYASLYTDRAIKYREVNGFAHEKVALSVGIQKMVRSDKACSGVGFTLEPESGFRNIIHISGVWGLGENLVQGSVTPDEYFVFKPTLVQNKNAIVQKKLGEKALTMVYTTESAETPTVNMETPHEKRDRFVLTDVEVTNLANWALLIEQHYNKPMDFEWAKDGITGELFITQARPETVQSAKNPFVVNEYKLTGAGQTLCAGNAIGSKVATGIARLLNDPSQSDQLKEGEIIVTDMTSPDWDPVLQKAAAIVTNKGGRTSHASIVARELGVPAIVGCGNATDVIKDGDWITVSCCEGKTGKVYKGKLSFQQTEHDFSHLHKPENTEVMLIAGDPDQAFKHSFYPNDGVGLMRMEFIINHSVKIHPMALVKYNELKNVKVKETIDQLTHQYTDKKTYFVDKLAQGIAVIAAAFHPKDVIVRLSDFKTNEYAHLIGGADFEPTEENPMLGFRGASRYYNPLYSEGFKLECAAIRKVRDEMGLTNVKVMVPFCRTLTEAQSVLDVMADNGLNRKENKGLQIYMMAEIPSNVILAEEFAQLFDGFSIGSNDLTQLTLGVDRDSAIVSSLFNEKDPASKWMIATVIGKAKKAGIKIGLCGQAPSDYQEFARFLVEQGIDSISFNPDALVRGIENVLAAEAEQAMPTKKPSLVELSA